MDIRQLRTFSCVAELGSLSKASDTLRVAQPALSRQIKLLEHELRADLFTRNGRGMVLTDAGRLLLAHTEKSWRDQYLTSVAFKVKTAIPVTRASLTRELEKIRSDGVSSSIDGYSIGLAAIAAPVFDGEGKCIASLNVAGPSDRFRKELDTLRAIVKEVAAKASGVVGGVESKRASKAA